METETMGKVIVTAMIENLEDLYRCRERIVAARTKSGALKSMMPSSTPARRRCCFRKG